MSSSASQQISMEPWGPGPAEPIVWDSRCRRLRKHGRFWSPWAGWKIGDAVRIIQALGFMVRGYQGGRDILRPGGGTIGQQMSNGAVITWAKRAYRNRLEGSQP
jgi:hypothetical protein